MNQNSIIIRCPKCGTKNRVSADRYGQHGTCGKCGARLPPVPLYPEKIIEVTDDSFATEVRAFPGPVLVQFMAPW